MALPHIRLMTRRDCCLCDEAKALLEVTAKKGLCSWEPVDVDRDKALLVRFGLDVPVLMLGEQVLCKHRVTSDELTSALVSAEETAV